MKQGAVSPNALHNILEIKIRNQNYLNVFKFPYSFDINADMKPKRKENQVTLTFLKINKFAFIQLKIFLILFKFQKYFKLLNLFFVVVKNKAIKVFQKAPIFKKINIFYIF